MAGENTESKPEISNVDKTAAHTPAIKETLTLPILELIKEAQQQHGLRHGDYQRYRSYCTRRIRRLRKTLHLVQGSKNRFQSKRVTGEVLKDVKYLYIPLMTAERAWSYSMQLKQEANTETRKKFHVMSRLRKAVQHTQELETLCLTDKCDARTNLEAQAYAAWMKGALLFEMQDWTSAIEQYRKAQTIYEKLASALTEDDRVIYRQRVEDITPNIRYCSYNIGDESAINDLKQLRFTGTGEDQLGSNLDALILQTREKQAATLSEVKWRGRTVPVRHEKVRLFLLNANERSSEVGGAGDEEKKMHVYDTLLMEARDALQVLRDELKADPKSKGQSDGQVSSLNFLHSYVTYLRQMMTVERNQLILEEMKCSLPQPDGTANPLTDGKKPSKPQDLVRLYEIIIQSLGEIIQLPGVEEDVNFVQELQAQVRAYKAFRCYFIALVFSTARKWPEAMALYQRVLKYIKEANSAGNLDKNLKAKCQELQQNVNGLQQSAHALSIIGSQESSDLPEKKSINNKALVDRLEEYYEDGQLRSKNVNITSFPPDFQPIPCKPLFFDLALNHVELPDLEDRLEQRKAGGLTGLVKGWLWGGGAKK